MIGKTKSKTIKIPIYFGDLILIQTNDRGLIKERYLKNIDVDIDAYEGLTIHNTHNGYRKYLIWVKEDVPIVSVAHESLHAANYILNNAMVRVTLENDEAQAYLMGWIFKQCLKYFKTT